MLDDEAIFSTPMMKQYQEIKKQYPDCLLFFRLGDFYELFLEDALIGSKVLDITLTGRPRGKDGRIPMAGVPFHAVDAYLTKLVKAGHKVAICEQVSEPDKHGIVEREVIRVVTPGTVLDEKSLNSNENNFIITLTVSPKSLGLACADISTGEFKAGEIAYTNLEKTLSDEISRIGPAECILSEKEYNNPRVIKTLSHISGLNIYHYPQWTSYAEKAEAFLKKELRVASLYGFGLDNKQHATASAAALYGYLKETQKDKLFHITAISEFRAGNQMSLDRATSHNLELFSPLRENQKSGTLISVLDQTYTAGGARLLRQWIQAPLTQLDSINDRFDAVELLQHEVSIRSTIEAQLKIVPDIERIVARLSVGIGNARDLISLKNALKNAVVIADTLRKTNQTLLQTIHTDITSNNAVSELIQLIEKHILDDPAFDPKDGGIIKSGINQELDQLQGKTHQGKEWIVELETTERERTKISSLKVRFNKVFGFYIEVSNSNLNLIPKDYQRKQTLVNGERFTTPELKKQEEIILTAEEKSKLIEYQIYQAVLEKIIDKVSAIQSIAKAISTIDCLVCFATIASDNRYIRPIIVHEGQLTINQGRHPVVEKLISEHKFIPNDTLLNNDQHQLLLLTGPNMAGKSVYMRQAALIVLMAHCGSFVPAKSATIPLTDKIFVRSGASDMISAGLSTFMVEMVETAYILQNASPKSLIIMDEIGRGTSTYDGISIAWAIAEYIVKNPKLRSKTLFATHYHELQRLEDQYPEQIKNFHMAIREENGQPVFLHTIQEGGAAHSFGVAVANLAGIPQEVIQNAQKMLHELESRQEPINNEEESSDKEQLEFTFTKEDPIVKEIQEIDIHQLTPLQALNKLSEIKNKLKLMHYTNRDFHKAD